MTASRTTWSGSLGSMYSDDAINRRLHRRMVGYVPWETRAKYLAAIPDLETKARLRTQVMLTCVCGEDLLSIELRDQRDFAESLDRVAQVQTEARQRGLPNATYGFEPDDLIRFVAVYPSPSEFQPPAAVDLDVSSVIKPPFRYDGLPRGADWARVRFQCGKCPFTNQIGWSRLELYYVLGSQSSDLRAKLVPLPISDMIHGKSKNQLADETRPLDQDDDWRDSFMTRMGYK